MPKDKNNDRPTHSIKLAHTTLNESISVEAQATSAKEAVNMAIYFYRYAKEGRPPEAEDEEEE